MTVRLHQTDRTIFHLLSQLHFLTTSQIATYFGRHESAINRRLSRLAEDDAGYVFRDRETINDQYIWHPKPKAITELVKADVLASPEAASCKGRSAGVKLDHKEHEVALSDVLLAIIKECGERSDGTVVVEKLSRGSALQDGVKDRDGVYYRVRPDACVVLRIAGQPRVLFIEVDRGTKDLKRSTHRASRYVAPYDIHSQLYAYTLYAERGAFKKMYNADSFRVLIAARTDTKRDDEISTTRRNNMLSAGIHAMARQRRRPPGSPLRYYATLGDAIERPFGSICLLESDPKILGTLAWIEQEKIGWRLADRLPEDSHADVRAAMADAKMLQRAYRRPKNDYDPVRNALLDALIAAGRLQLRSILEDWSALE